jgi:murein DD-endopeptidase MepM/ murein hydrolase activator NlpD
MGFVLTACLAVVTFIAATIPAITVPGVGSGDGPLYPAPPGYQLPWPGGEIESVTQGEETPFTHNGLSAYALDFGLNYDTVVAARSGKVAMVYAGSNSSGCDPSLNVASNYVVIDHGDGTAALYLHLAYDSVLVAVGDIVEQGKPLASSGDTGMTCDGDGDEETDAGAPHLHFQVQAYEEHHYMTQSLPIAFDDIRDNEGVPVEGKSYVSGNYLGGRPQKSTLTPWRSQRIFSPKATPEDPSLSEIPVAMETELPIEQVPADVPTEMATETPVAEPTPETIIVEEPTPTVETIIVDEDDTPTAEPPDTHTPEPSGTPQPGDTPTPDDTVTSTASDTSTAEPEQTP